MRSWLPVLLLSLLGCPKQTKPDAVEPSGASPTSGSAEARVEPAVEPTVEPEPTPALVFVDDGWVRRPEDPTAPLLRLTTLEPSGDDGPAAIRALLGTLEPLMTCYEAELQQDPERYATLWTRRRAPQTDDPEGIELGEAPHPTALVRCADPVLRQALPAASEDPHGRYELRLYPHHDDAPRLQRPEPEAEVIEREGGSCWTRRTYPCKPHKICRAPDWERTLCRHPAQDPEVALRWAFEPVDDQRWRISAVELTTADGSTIWRTALDADDVERLGVMDEADVERHRVEFREHPLPRSWWVALEPRRVMLADRAGVRVYDRTTGELRFRYTPREPEATRLWFDDGTFTARKGKQRCKGDARHGAFVARCGEDLLYFYGHGLAVIAVADAVWLRGQSTLDDPGSKRGGNAVRPTASLKAVGYRVKIEGMVYMQ